MDLPSPLCNPLFAGLNQQMPERILPIKEDINVAVIGHFAIAPRYQGAGSSVVNPQREAKTIAHLIHDYPVNLIEVLEALARVNTHIVGIYFI